MKQYTLPSQTEMGSYYILYKGSAVAESRDGYGISHLSEHIICRKLNERMPDLYRYAIEFNAFTTDDYIGYYIYGLEEYVDRFAKQMDDLFADLSYSEEDFEAEKRIVIEELSSTKHYNTIYELIGATVGYSGPAGTVDAVRKLTYQQIQDFIRLQYKQPYMTVRVGQNCIFDCKETGVHYALKPQLSLKDLCVEPRSWQTEQEMIFVGCPIHNDFLPLSQVINYMLCGNIKSPLYDTLRVQMHLCYSINLNYFTFGDYHVNILRVRASKDNRELIKEKISQLLQQDDCLTQTALTQTVDYFRILNRMHETNRYADIKHLLCNTVFAPGQLDAINSSKIWHHYNKFYQKNFVI